jgi:hypothetical protein
MQQLGKTMHKTENTEQMKQGSEWARLSASCTHCIDLAQTLATQLKNNATTAPLNSLLQESAKEVRQLQAGIRHLAQYPLRADEVQQHRQLLTQMQTLLHLEEGNHSLLGSKGILLNRPRPYRYQPRRKAQGE